MRAHVPGEYIGDCIEKRAAVMGNDAFGVAGSARRVAERDRLPFVARQLPGEFGIAGCQEILVFNVTDPLAVLNRGIIDVYDERLIVELLQGRCDGRAELGVGEQYAGAAVLQLKSYRVGVEANVDRMNDRARHRDGVMRLVHCRYVREHQRDGVVCRHAVLLQGAGEPATAAIRFRPAASHLVVNQGTALGIDRCGPFDKRQR